MASQGPNYPDSGTTLNNAGTSENAEPWVNPGNIVADDANEAVITAATYDSPDISALLVASDFDFALPATTVIRGIIVEVMRRNSAGAASDNRLQLATGTTFADLVGTNKADTATDWPTTEALATYGSSTDLWSAGLTVSQINSTGFAVFLSVQADAANTDIQVDFIRVTVHYDAVIEPALLDQTAVPTAPTVTSQATIAPALVDQTASPSAPTVELSAGQNIAPALLDRTATATAPTVTTTATVAPALIDRTAAATAPTVAAQATISPALLNQAAQPTAPVLSAQATISPALLDRTAVATAPSVSTGAVSLSIPLLSQLAAAFGPSVTQPGLEAYGFPGIIASVDDARLRGSAQDAKLSGSASDAGLRIMEAR
jgi:hypothetical protein